MDRTRVPDVELYCPACGEFRLIDVWAGQASCSVCSRSWSPARVVLGADPERGRKGATGPATDVSGHPMPDP